MIKIMNSSKYPESPMLDLLRRTQITSKARYHSARRLSLHGWYSQWTLALLAVGQLVISLIPALKLKSSFSEAYLNFGGIFFGVLVLAYSLLLGMGNFPARSQKMHECGLEMGRLARQLTLWTDGKNATDEQYDKAAKEYYDTLSKYENHTNIDFLVASFDFYERKNIAEKFYKDGVIKFWHILQFSHYFVSIFLVSFWIYFAIAK
jgi:hypothetical protein